MLTLPPPYRLRWLTLSDIDTVLEIDRLSFPSPTKKTLLTYELTENKLAHYFGLCRSTALVGYAGYWVLGDEVHISSIAVHPEWRRRGYGEMLLCALLQQADTLPVTLVTLEVRENNRAAQELYEKYDFEVVGIRQGYYRDTGENAWIMTRSPLDAPYHNFLQASAERIWTRLASKADP